MIVLLWMLVMPLQAQVGEKRNDFAIGGNAGMLMTRMDITPTIKQTLKNAPTFGFSARYICEKYFTAICGVAMEVNYANIGWKEQIEDGKRLLSKKADPSSAKYIAYFQAFTNTYAPAEKLESIFMPVIIRDDIAALSIATRPDCLQMCCIFWKN